MKSRIFTLLMFVGITAFSQGNIVFFTENGELFFVSMNGVKINAAPMSNVKVEGVKAPGAMAMITFSDPALGSVHKNVMAADGREYTFKVNKNKKGEWKIHPFTDTPMDAAVVSSTTTTTNSDPVLIQQKVGDPVADQPVQNTTTVQDGGTGNTTTMTTITNTNIQSNANPSETGVSMNVNTNGTQNNQPTASNTNVQSTTTANGSSATTSSTQSTTQPKGISINVNINSGSLKNALNAVVNTTTNALDGTSSTTTSTTTSSNDAAVSDNSQTQAVQNTTTASDPMPASSSVMTSASGCSMAMDAGEFNDAKSSISSKSFEDSKMKVAKQVADNNCFSTSQVKELMGLFTYEDSKLDFAKYAYAYTVDKNNYYKINDAFTYESSISDLQAYIKANK